jgi:hypothetical protein
MLKKRIALAGVVVIVAGLGVAPAAWADRSPGPPGPNPHNTGDLGNPGDGSVVCHDYPGALVFHKNGHSPTGSPDPSGICLD